MMFLVTFTLSLLIGQSQLTVDLNEAELQYIADHLLPEECRMLVASAHIKTYEAPKDLAEGERKVPNELTCFELLLHWNGAKGEGKGESHTLLEHRLRQIGRRDLADWLGRTVFKELEKDLNDSLDEGLKDLANDTVTTEDDRDLPTLVPDDEPEDAALWTPFDSICYTLIEVIIITVIALPIFACCRRIKGKCGKKKNDDGPVYEKIGEVSDEESEDKFDIRNTPKIKD